MIQRIHTHIPTLETIFSLKNTVLFSPCEVPYSILLNSISILLNSFNVQGVSQHKFYNAVLKSSEECLGPLLGTEDMCLLSYGCGPEWRIF